jgi:hypothetical protein
MKKDETRFTIRFNPTDPRHKKTMEVLSAAGRRKSTLIADAICDYLIRYSNTVATSAFPIAPSSYTSHSIYNGISANDFPVQTAEPPTVIGNNTDTNEINNLEMPLYDDDMQNTILDGLSAFTM